MSRLIKLLKGRSGASLVFTAIIFMAIMMIATGMWEYARVKIISSGIRDATENAVVAVGTANMVHTYDGAREGYSGAYRGDGAGGWAQYFENNGIMDEVKESLGLSNDYTKYSGGEVEYTLELSKMEVANEDLAPVDPASSPKLKVTGIMNVTIPHAFGWEAMPPIKLRLGIDVRFTPRF
jgi:hypothetical protein